MKPRRDITLGEIQDECKRFTDGLCGGKSCAYQDLCNQMKSGCAPHAWDLTDPPRFTEAQMAFLRGCYEVGIVGLLRNGDNIRLHFLTTHGTIGYLHDMGLMIPIKVGETLDLAELLGKDGEK